MVSIKKQLILASTSPARRALLSRLQIPFEVCPSEVDETPHPKESAHELVSRLATAKAQAVVKKYPEAIIIGADQVGVLNKEIILKPMTRDQGVKTFKLVSGNVVRFLTAICLWDATTQHHELSVETYDVHFKEITDSMIEHYLQKENSLQCAGGFQIEGLGIALVQELSGNDYTSLIGLPLIRLTNMLKDFGIEVLG